MHEEAKGYRQSSSQERCLSGTTQLREQQQGNTERNKQALQQGIHSPNKTN